MPPKKKIPKKNLKCATLETKKGEKYTTCYDKKKTPADKKKTPADKKKIKFNVKKAETKPVKKKIKFNVKKPAVKKPAVKKPAVKSYGLGDPKGFASHFGVNPGGGTTGFLSALGMVEPGLVNMIMGQVKPKRPTQDVYDELKYQSGFKSRDFAKQVKKIQWKDRLDKKGQGRAYSFVGGDVDRLNKALDQGTSTKGGDDRAGHNIANYMESELARLKPGTQAKSDARQAKNKAKDKTKVNLSNVYDLLDWDELPYDSSDYTGNILESMMYSGELTGYSSERAHERAMEKAGNWEHQRVKRSIGAFIKGKKFKDANEATNAYVVQMKSDNDYHEELDRYA